MSQRPTTTSDREDPTMRVSGRSLLPRELTASTGPQTPTAPLEGGFVGVDASAGGGSVIDSPASVGLWRECNGVSEVPTLVQLPDNDPEDGSTVTRLRFRVAFPTVEAFHVVGGGHTEPSLQARYRLWCMPIVGPQHGDTEMAEEVWSFFSWQGRAAH
ncbi:MAG: hypothetical protein ACO3JL_05620 [Myxococcota bacterium]